MKKHMLRAALALLLCVGIVSTGSGSSLAATPAKPKSAETTNNANTLKISPVRTDLTVQPGATGHVNVLVSNLTKAPIVIHPIENDFVAGDEKGTPAIILDENSYAPTHSLKRFMVPLKDVTIPAGGGVQVDVVIAVPKTAQPGGYFGAIRFAPANAPGSKSVNLSASVASLILMTVPGETTEKLSLTDFKISQDGSTSTNFRTPNNLSLLVRFQNKGNIQEAPFGQIYVKKGDKVVYSSSFNQADPKDSVLPDSARRWDVPLKNLGKFGKYTVGATFTYGVNKSQSIEVTKTIWIIPSNYIVGAIGAVVGLILLIVLLVVSLRAYKRRILRGSRGYRR